MEYTEKTRIAELLELEAVRTFAEGAAPQLFEGPALAYIGDRSVEELKAAMPGERALQEYSSFRIAPDGEVGLIVISRPSGENYLRASQGEYPYYPGNNTEPEERDV